MKSIHLPSIRSLKLAACLLLGSVLGWSPGHGQDATPPYPESTWLPARLEWFQDLKFGFMMHWAPYSQWGCIESWPLVEEDKFGRPDDLKAWTERGKDMARFTRDYWALPKTFNPVKFNPRQWADAAKQAGMRYVVFTTKHHDGFAMFDTKLSDYRITAPDVPFTLALTRNDPPVLMKTDPPSGRGFLLSKQGSAFAAVGPLS